MANRCFFKAPKIYCTTLTVTAFHVCLYLCVSDIILFPRGTSVRLSGNPWRRSHSIGVSILTPTEFSPKPFSFWTTNKQRLNVLPNKQLDLLLVCAVYFALALLLLKVSTPRSSLFFCLCFFPSSVLVSFSVAGVCSFQVRSICLPVLLCRSMKYFSSTSFSKTSLSSWPSPVERGIFGIFVQ